MPDKSRIKVFLQQWQEKVARSDAHTLTGAEVALLVLFEEWCFQYDRYEAENEEYRQGRLAGEPVYQLPKL